MPGGTIPYSEGMWMQSSLKQEGLSSQVVLNDVGMHIEILPMLVQEFLYHKREHVNRALLAPG